MKPIIPILFLSFGSFLSAGESGLELVSVEAPDTVVIDRNFNPDRFWVEIEFLYKYSGQSISGVSLSHCPRGDIQFITPSGNPLPVALHYFLNNGCDGLDTPEFSMWCQGMGWLENMEIFKNGLKKKFRMVVIDPDLLKNTDVLEAITNEELAWVQVDLDTVEIKWEDQAYVRSAGKEGKNGAFNLKLAREFKIKVKYEQ